MSNGEPEDDEMEDLDHEAEEPRDEPRVLTDEEMED